MEVLPGRKAGQRLLQKLGENPDDVRKYIKEILRQQAAGQPITTPARFFSAPADWKPSAQVEAAYQAAYAGNDAALKRLLDKPQPKAPILPDPVTPKGAGIVINIHLTK